MPGFDGSGPMGAGPMTGGARGNCNSANAVYPMAGSTGFGRGMANGRGFRGGNGFGRGVRRGFARGSAMVPQMVTENTADELSMLKQQADLIKNTMDSISNRIAELEKKDVEI